MSKVSAFFFDMIMSTICSDNISLPLLRDIETVSDCFKRMLEPTMEHRRERLLKMKRHGSRKKTAEAHC